MAKKSDGMGGTLLVLGVAAVTIGLLYSSSKRKQQGTKGVGCGCGCNGAPGGCGGGTRGLGMPPPAQWYGSGDDYRPFEPALAARQHMIPPMPSQG